MDKEALKNINVGEYFCKMQECTLHGMDVIDVTLYTCVKIFGMFNSVKKIHFPFYFASIKLVEKFLKYYEYFKIYDGTYDEYGDAYHCYRIGLKNNSDAHKWYMIDEYKHLYRNNEYKFDNEYKFIHLTKGGIWNGDVIWDGDGHSYMKQKDIVDFMQVIDHDNIAIKKDKTYVFKMIKDND